MSASLHTQTVLHCLIIQVLNTMSLLPKCLTQSYQLLLVVKATILLHWRPMGMV